MDNFLAAMWSELTCREGDFSQKSEDKQHLVGTKKERPTMMCLPQPPTALGLRLAVICNEGLCPGQPVAQIGHGLALAIEHFAQHAVFHVEGFGRWPRGGCRGGLRVVPLRRLRNGCGVPGKYSCKLSGIDGEPIPRARCAQFS
jgi:hypothetical protein